MARCPQCHGGPAGSLIIDVIEISYYDGYECRVANAYARCFGLRLHDFADWVWFDATNRFMDAEVAALVCPRPLCVEVGLKDEIFNLKSAIETTDYTDFTDYE